MKYAFIVGSNAFIVPSRVVVYADKEGEHEFLRINSVYRDLPSNTEQYPLDIDLHIKDTNETEISLLSNKIAAESTYVAETAPNSVKVLRADGSLVVNIHQLDDEAAMGLEHNIVAELEVHDPVVVIRITGEFLIDGLHIRAENEKLFINDIGYATSAMTGQNQLVFTPDGVVL